eukprot:756107-Hanusia_phi.AAC.3
MAISAPCCLITWPIILLSAAFLLPCGFATLLSLIAVLLFLKAFILPARSQVRHAALIAMAPDDSHLRARIKYLMEAAKRAPALTMLFGPFPALDHHK